MENAMQTFWNGLNLQPVDIALMKTLNGIPVQMNFESELFKGKYIRGISQDIVEFTGIFQAAIDSCCIETFNAQISEYNTVKNGDTETKVPTYCQVWMTLNLSYPGNGMQILSAWYNENNDGKWKFRSEKSTDLFEIPGSAAIG